MKWIIKKLSSTSNKSKSPSGSSKKLMTKSPNTNQLSKIQSNVQNNEII